MRSDYLDTKYVIMNEAGMKRDYFYVMEYAAALHDDTLTILSVGCVKSKWSNRISNFSKKKKSETGYLFMTCYWQRSVC